MGLKNVVGEKDKIDGGCLEMGIDEANVNVERDFVREEIEDFLNLAKEEGIEKNYRNVARRIVEEFDRIEAENGVFLENERGEAVLRYFKYMYENYPDKLTRLFSDFPIKYGIFKVLNFSDEFVKKDFEHNLEMKSKEVFWESCKYFLENFSGMAEEYIRNYSMYSGSFLLKLGILVVIKNFNIKNESEIDVLNNIFVNYVRDIIYRNEKDIIFEKYLDSSNFKRHFKNVKMLNVEKVRKYIEKIFFSVLDEHRGMSEIVDEGMELLVIFSEVEFSSTNSNYYYQNKIFNKLEKYFERYKFSHAQKIYMLINYGMSVIFYNSEYSRKMYNLFLKTVSGDWKGTKEFFEAKLKENRFEYLFLLHFFIKENYIDGEEKEKFLKISERMLIEDLKKVFSMGMWEWKSPEFSNFDFLNEENVEWENIEVRYLGNKTGNSLINRDKIIFSLVEYSEVYKKVFQFMVKCVKNVQLFKDIFERFDIIEGISDVEAVLDRMWGYGLTISFINEGYLEHTGKLKFNKKNNETWIKFLHNHEKDLYRSFENGVESAKSVESYVDILYVKNNTFDYLELPKLLWKASRNTAYQIEKILKPKEDSREVVEKIIGKLSGNSLEVAKNLIKYWNNAKAQRELEKMAVSKESLLEYVDTICLDKHEINAVFHNKVDYGSIRIKGSEEKIPEKFIKFYISEYILSNDIKELEVCTKIEEMIEKTDLQNFLEKIFESWKDERFNPKYKNIFIPLILNIDIKKINNVINIVDVLVSEYNKVAVAAYGIRVLALREEIKETGIIIKSFIENYKDKRIKMAAEETLEMIAENRGITRDELNDVLVPDFGFRADRTKFYNYGDREIKIKLDISKNPMKIVIFDQNGKIARILPKANKRLNDIEPAVEKYKREIKIIRRHLREISATQGDSLLKALVLGRKWKAPKWLEIFVKNPVMQKYAIQLVWEETDKEGRIIRTFRYTENGTFLTADEKECTVGEENFINLAYFPEFSEGEKQKWIKNLENSGIVQPIGQLEIPVYKITEKNKEKIEIIDYNEKKTFVSTIRKKSSSLDFKVDYGKDGIGHGSYHYDKESGIKIIISTNSFSPGEYSKKLNIEKISFHKEVKEKYSKNSSENGNLQPLQLGDVPERLLSLACLMAEILVQQR